LEQDEEIDSIVVDRFVIKLYSPYWSGFAHTLN
jgi:hypothetical protein